MPMTTMAPSLMVSFCSISLMSRFNVFFGNQAFIEVGLPIGDDFGLVFGHAGPGQAFDEGVGVEGGLRLHGAQNSGWGGRLQVDVALSS